MTLTAVEGIFKDGRIELRETPENIREARVIVTFLANEEVANEVADLTSPSTLMERLHAFQSLIESLPPAPTVPLAAFDREDLYP